MISLTERQQEIVAARCDSGETVDECAYRLGIAQQTVKNHVSDIIRRLEVISFYQVCTLYGKQDERFYIPATDPKDV